MAITRTAKGTATFADDPLETCTIAGVSIVAGASIVVEALTAVGGAGLSAVEWNGASLSLERSVAIPLVGGILEIWSKHNCSAATGDVVAHTANPDVGDVLLSLIQLSAPTGELATDKKSSASGTGTAPSSGAAATTTKADEMLLGFVGQGQGVLDVAGTWDNSFSDGQSVKNGSSIAMNDGYRSVSATGAYTASKSGSTSSTWAAIIATFYEVNTAWTKSLSDSVTVTDAMSKSIGKTLADAVTVTDDFNKRIGKSLADTVGVTDGMDTQGVFLRSLADTVTVTDELVPSLLGYYPGGAAPLSVDTPTDPTTLQPAPDPWSGQRSPIGSTTYNQAVSGMKSCGSPYASAIQQDLAASAGLGGGDWTLLLTFAVHSMPVMIADPDEVHIIFSAHEPIPGGKERVAIGITPSGRLVGRTADHPDLLTPIGVVSADNVIHQAFLKNFGGELGMDGVIIVHANVVTDGDGFLPGFYPKNGSTLRFMAFNGIDGRTRCSCSIFNIEIDTENDPVSWRFNEGHGLVVNDFEMVSTGPGENGWVDRSLLPDSPPPGPPVQQYPSPSDYGDTNDFGLTADWYDPLTMGLPRLYGPLPTSAPQSCMKWAPGTPYSAQGDPGTIFSSQPPPSPGFTRGGPAGATTYTRDNPPVPPYTRS